MQMLSRVGAMLFVVLLATGVPLTQAQVAEDARAGCYSLTHAWADTVAHLPSGRHLPEHLILTDEPFLVEHPHGSGTMKAIDGLEEALRVAYPEGVPDNQRYFQYWIRREEGLRVAPLAAVAGFYLDLRPNEARLTGELVGYTDDLTEDPHVLAVEAALVPAVCDR